MVYGVLYCIRRYTAQHWVKLFSLSMNFHALKQSDTIFTPLCSRVAICTVLQNTTWPRSIHQTPRVQGSEKKNCLICSSETSIKKREKNTFHTFTYKILYCVHTTLCYTIYIYFYAERMRARDDEHNNHIRAMPGISFGVAFPRQNVRKQTLLRFIFFFLAR